MTIKDNMIASILVNICRRSNDLDLDLILYGAWLESKGAVPRDFSDENSKPTSGHQGSVTN